MNKFITIAIIGILLIGMAGVSFLYKNEMEKNLVLRSENLKTGEEAQGEVKLLKEELKKEKDANLDDKKKLLDQMAVFSKEKEKAIEELGNLKKGVLKERELSLVANDDLEMLRKEVSVLRKESREGIGKLEDSFKKKKQLYETRILSLEAQLDKYKGRLAADAQRYHYNLGVLYTQNKDFETAVKEFKACLSANPKNAQAHYNLGIIFDDYFKDKENARYHYRTFLELAPTSEDAESVREWLANLNK
jgi:tetratricopeptide (TPR) repeat protein